MSNPQVPGVDEAIQHYGEPVVREYRYDVGAPTLMYWQLTSARRQAEVVLVVRRPGGKFLLHTKAFYPVGAYRLLSGGIKAGEDLISAVVREACEETGLEVRIARFLAIQHHRFCHAGQEVRFTSYIMLVDQGAGSVASNDDGEEITDFREVELSELCTVADKLEALSAEWADWGRFRASAHRLTAELLADGSA